MSESKRTFNFDQLEEVTGGDSEFERELLEEYMSDTPNTFSRLEKAIQTGEYSAAQLEAHSLKGSSQSLGAESLGYIAGCLESMSQEGTAEGAESLLEDLQAEFTRVCQAINQRLHKAA